MMAREIFMDKIPNEWKRRAKVGLCPVCGKPPSEFNKGQKVYCSSKCREEYRSKYMFWNDLKERAFDKYGNKCNICGITNEKLRRKIKEKNKERIRKWIDENKEFIEAERHKALVHLDEKFAEEFKEIMNDNLFVRRHWLVPDKIRRKTDEYVHGRYEVDHIVPIALGGEMWDIENLQILCHNCHKKKTKKDMNDLKNMKEENKIKQISEKHKKIILKDAKKP